MITMNKYARASVMAEKRARALEFAEGGLKINLILKLIVQLLMSLTN